MIVIPCVKKHENARLPSKAHDDDAAFDLFAVERTVVSSRSTPVRTGISMEIPPGYYVKLEGRSGLARDFGMRVDGVILNGEVRLAGIIDWPFQGEPKALLSTLPGMGNKVFEVGDAFCQMTVHEVIPARAEWADQLSRVTDRGESGFGDSDKRRSGEILQALIPKEGQGQFIHFAGLPPLTLIQRRRIELTRKLTQCIIGRHEALELARLLVITAGEWRQDDPEFYTHPIMNEHSTWVRYASELIADGFTSGKMVEYVTSIKEASKPDDAFKEYIDQQIHCALSFYGVTGLMYPPQTPAPSVPAPDSGRVYGWAHRAAEQINRRGIGPDDKKNVEEFSEIISNHYEEFRKMTADESGDYFKEHIKIDRDTSEDSESS